MERTLLLLLAALVAGGLAYLLLSGQGGRVAPAGSGARAPAEVPEDGPRTGTLTVYATTPDGKVAKGTEVGYVEGDHVRLLYAGEDGRRTFADAPLGDVTVVAKAPGCPEVRTRRFLTPGVPEEVRMILHPQKD